MADTESDIFATGADVLSEGLTAPENEIDTPVDAEFQALHGDSYRFDDDSYEITPGVDSGANTESNGALIESPEVAAEVPASDASDPVPEPVSELDSHAFASLTEALKGGPSAGLVGSSSGAVTGPTSSYFKAPEATDSEALPDSITPRRRAGAWEFVKTHRVLSVGAAVLVLLVLLVGMRGLFGGSSSPSTNQTAIALPPPQSAKPTTGAPRVGMPGDAPIKPKVSPTSKCPAGSTSPDLAFDGSMDTAWTCVMSFGAPGQVLRIELDGWYVIEAMTIVPGFNAPAADGSDQWVRYQTVSRVYYEFNDSEGTGNEQQTMNLRDEVVTPIRTKTGGPVVASALTVTIRETAKPVSAPAQAGRGGAAVKPVGPAAATTTSGKQQDPTSFAVSEISIIGHKAR